VPALDVIHLESRVREAVLRLVDRILRPGERGRRGRRRLLPSPFGRAQRPHDETVRYLTGLGSGNLRLLVGMVRANRPWRLAAGLALASVLIICLTLIVVHELWERSPDPRAVQRVVLFNLATALTIVLGLLTLYATLFVVTVAGGFALIPEGVISKELQYEVGLGEHVRLPWLVSSLATLGGALGSAVETEQAVRAAAYGYREGEEEEDAV